MKIQQIRNATLKITFGGITFLLDPWLQDKGAGRSYPTIRPEMQGVKSPLIDLPMSPEEILAGVDYCLVTHLHSDHFTEDYLPKDVKILTANSGDSEKIKNLGFKNVSVIDDKNTEDELIGIQIAKTPAIHGEKEEIALQMGDVSGYLLTGEKLSLYIAGDTVFNEEIAEILEKYKPDVITLNCDEATTSNGRLIMGLDDIKAVCTMCPHSKVILTHLDTVNHALLSSEDVRAFVKKEDLKNAVVLENGKTIDIT